MYKKMDIFGLFIENPQKKFHIREVARILKISPMTARKRLNELSKEGILMKRKDKIYDNFSANQENEKFKLRSRDYFIEKFIDSGLIEFLEEELVHPKAIFLFGSHAKGDYIAESDIDLFVLSNEKKELNLSKFEKKLKKKIQLFVMTSKEFEEAKRKNPELINNIINGIKIGGYLDVI